MRAVISSVDASLLGMKSPTSTRQRAIPEVTILTGINAAPVFLARTAGNGVVEARRPKNGVQTPLSPACWSIKTPSIPPFRKTVTPRCNPSALSIVTTPELSLEC